LGCGEGLSPVAHATCDPAGNLYATGLDAAAARNALTDMHDWL
jgi:hypothetical protein